MVNTCSPWVPRPLRAEERKDITPDSYCRPPIFPLLTPPISPQSLMQCVCQCDEPNAIRCAQWQLLSHTQQASAGIASLFARTTTMDAGELHHRTSWLAQSSGLLAFLRMGQWYLRALTSSDEDGLSVLKVAMAVPSSFLASGKSRYAPDWGLGRSFSYTLCKQPLNQWD
ncbi:hypothetical protein LZ32DRAFT_650938 [Colletotrichum eremochloae]|nr:hypothetical protein LZ32DRAFT_650938 [Colletotrichum eremochloae]